MILDHIDNLELSDDDEDYLFDAQMTLARLSHGLFWLHTSVYDAEQQARREAAKDNTEISFINGVIEEIPVWLTSAFQWYAVSAYNYVRLAGWLAYRDKYSTNTYVKKVIPRITEYRHKIAAHFAITNPRNDNEADLIASIMTNLVYARGYLRAGALSEILKDKQGNEVEASNKISWSLTKEHKKLEQRYWPSGPLRATQSIKISAGATRTFKVDYED